MSKHSKKSHFCLFFLHQISNKFSKSFVKNHTAWKFSDGALAIKFRKKYINTHNYHENFLFFKKNKTKNILVHLFKKKVISSQKNLNQMECTLFDIKNHPNLLMNLHSSYQQSIFNHDLPMIVNKWI